MEKSKVIVILGTTASGKTDAAIALAKKFNGEIISADSRQVYRGMDIGTGKELEKYQENKKTRQSFDAAQDRQKNKKKLHAVSYHIIDIISPRRQFTVADFQKRAYGAIDDILGRGKVPILCGGTGLYIDAVVRGYRFHNFQFPISNFQKLRKRLEKYSLNKLLTLLKKVDKETYQIIDKKNRRRVQRALEIYSLTGKTKSEQIAHNKPPYTFMLIGMTLPKDILKKRISRRLTERLRQGMRAEVRKLHAQGVSWKRLESFGLEYRWISRSLQGKIQRNEMEKGLLQDIFSFAKRQMTWFKRNPDIHWVKTRREIISLAKKFLNSNSTQR